MQRALRGLSAAMLAAALAACGGGGADGETSAGDVDAVAEPSGGAAPDTAAGAWLAAHNAARAGSLPGVTLNPAPSPALPALAWSPKAAAVAQAWADGCRYQHNPNRGADGVARGENIAATAPAGRSDVTPAWVVAQWGGEWVDYDHASNACSAGKVCGHYTQLVWRATARVGCARATCNVNSPFGAGFPTWELLVCNYEPPGNFVGQRPY